MIMSEGPGVAILKFLTFAKKGHTLVLIHFISKVEQSATENSDFLPALKTILEIKPK